MSAASQLPNPAHALAESMLSLRFGKETVNYFSSTRTVAIC
jgi:NAD+ diphosphatase